MSASITLKVRSCLTTYFRCQTTHNLFPLRPYLMELIVLFYILILCLDWITMQVMSTLYYVTYQLSWLSIRRLYNSSYRTSSSAQNYKRRMHVRKVPIIKRDGMVTVLAQKGHTRTGTQSLGRSCERSCSVTWYLPIEHPWCFPRITLIEYDLEKPVRLGRGLLHSFLI